MNKPATTKDSPTILISGGGTGGHVFPAIAIASAIKSRISNARILFVGARGRMEMKKVPEAGFHIIGLDIAGLQRRPSLKNLLLPWKICKSLNASKLIVKRFKPGVVIGVGGYASGPLLWAASRQNVPVLIQEQNSFPGLTNRILGKKADKICVAYDGMNRYFPENKIFLTGNPVRDAIINIEGKRAEALEYFGLSGNKPVLLVTGGSLGARTINQSISIALEVLIDNGIQIIWQTGQHYYEHAVAKASKITNQSAIAVRAFIDRMDYAYAAADVVVSRAGAIAVSELAAANKPSILIPSPNVAEDHQTKNAIALVNSNAAMMIKDNDAHSQLGTVITELIFDQKRIQQLKENMARFSFRNASAIIADIAINMMNKK